MECQGYPIGHGETEAAAIADLLEQLEENEWANKPSTSTNGADLDAAVAQANHLASMILLALRTVHRAPRCLARHQAKCPGTACLGRQPINRLVSGQSPLSDAGNSIGEANSTPKESSGQVRSATEDRAIPAIRQADQSSLGTPDAILQSDDRTGSSQAAPAARTPRDCPALARSHSLLV